MDIIIDEPKLVESINFEFTVKKCKSKDLENNFAELFPNQFKEDNILERLHFIVCWTPTTLPMSGFSSATDEERESVASKFIGYATQFCNTVKNEYGHWADFIDPLSGVPYLNRDNANAVFVPTDAGVSLGVDIVDVGCCQVMKHPIWKVRAFFSVIVTTAPLDIISNSLHSIKPI
eukprot:gene2875-3573_t